jgi:hypothetical protein
LKNTRRTPSDEANKWRNLLFSFQGVALAFWLSTSPQPSMQ